MSGPTSIQWTDRTVNPIRARNKQTGAVGHFCEKVSPGCTHCYASKWNERVRPSGAHLIGTGLAFDVRNREQIEFFLDDAKLLDVLKRRQPTKWFWCDMTDMFGEWVPDEWIDRCFAVMALTPQHTHQVLTKRADRLRTYLEFRSRPPAITTTQDVLIAYARELGVDDAPAVKHIGLSKWPLPNVWLGVSAEDQERADERIPLLLQTPAAVRFISAEPLLGRIDLTNYLWSIPGARLNRLHWLIVGGESGSGSRACDLEWVRWLVAQCNSADVACFVKQLGAVPMMAEGDWRAIFDDRTLTPLLSARNARRIPGGSVPLKFHTAKAGDPSEWPEDLRVREFPAVSV